MKNNYINELSLYDVQSLRKICNRFGEPVIQEKKRLLLSFSKLRIEKVTALKEYHDCLLFLLAYPENEALLLLADSELQRLVYQAQQISEGSNEAKKLQMSASGISNSYITAAFTFDLAKWLSGTYPSNIYFHSCDADLLTQKEIIKLLLPSIEHEAFSKNFSSLTKWLHESNSDGRKNKLQILIRFFENAVKNVELRDNLYDSLQIFIDIKIDAHLPSRTSARINFGNLFFHTTELSRKVDVKEILSQKISAPVKLSLKEKEHLNAIAKCSLLMLLRETDPVTYSNVNATELHDMGRGIKIALYYISQDRRLPAESYIGYMAFKNNLPVSYGGGWVFGNFSRIGVNVYAPFRGGESALLFTQILRLYKQRFNVSAFEAEPYQIGKGNSEGIKSGAFWFYFRLGFRPAQPEFLKLAEDENNKIQNDKSYRTNEKTLKKLACSFMVLSAEKSSLKPISTLEISEAINRIIDDKFKGSRKGFYDYATKYVVNSLKLNSKTSGLNFDSKSFQELASFISLAKTVAKWSDSDKQKTRQLFELKQADSEYKFVHALQKHKKLWNEVFNSIHSSSYLILLSILILS